MTLISRSPKTNQEVIPHVRADVFSSNPDARFALGVFDGEEVVLDNPSPLVEAYLRLRANVYIDQIHVLGDEQRRSNGTERNEDDERSTHFVLFENKIGTVAVFGCMRLIEKSAANSNNLPIEDFFPESFDTPVQQGGIEVSRFIVRNDNPMQRALSKLNLIGTGLAHTLTNDLGPVFATIETEFNRDLRSVGVPTKKFTPTKLIDDYKTSNFGIEIDKYGLKGAIGTHAVSHNALNKGSIGNFWGSVEANEELQEA